MKTEMQESQRHARTFHLTLAYDGRRYSGWQVQSDQCTIQGELERVVKPLAGESVRILGSGRTDAGVHAVGQVARCALPRWNASARDLQQAINSKLPFDIRVESVREVIPNFHPIGDSMSKRYRYFLQIGGGRDPFTHRFVHRVPRPIDTGLLRDAAKQFVGRHDFAAFQASGAPRATTVRTMTSCEWFQCVPPGAVTRDPVDVDSNLANDPRGIAEHWCFEIEGDGFLYNMVRNLVGTMLDVARGRRPLEWVAEVLESKDRAQAGPTAPPHGLFLWQVHYPESVFEAGDQCSSKLHD